MMELVVIIREREEWKVTCILEAVRNKFLCKNEDLKR